MCFEKANVVVMHWTVWGSVCVFADNRGHCMPEEEDSAQHLALGPPMGLGIAGSQEGNRKPKTSA